MNNQREYTVEGRSTDRFGRVLCSARNHHSIIDGPEQNGCPGEEITPVEVFLEGVAACGVELVHVLAKERELALDGVHLTISGMVDRDHPVRTDLTVFNRVRLDFELRGVSRPDAEALVEGFKGR